MANGILGNGGLFGAAGGVAEELGMPGSSTADKAETYRKPLGTGSFNSFGATLVDTDTEVELARIESPAEIARRWGYGRADLPDNQAYLYGQLENADNEQIHGELSFEWENATGRETQVEDEASTRDMDTTDRYDRDQQLPMPERTDKNKATHNQYLVVTFTPETAAADITNSYEIDAGASEVRWVVTEYDES